MKSSALPHTPAGMQPDMRRSFLDDQAHQFLAIALRDGSHVPGAGDNLILERCAQYLMDVARCSQDTAATYAARAIAEVSSRGSRVSFDMNRSTSHALFVVDRATSTTRCISAAELLALLKEHEAKRSKPLVIPQPRAVA